MRTTCQTIGSHWNRSDTIVLGGNLLALGLFIANCWWGLISVAVIGALGPLGFQISRARGGDDVLRTALIVGGVAALIWPVSERAVATAMGWWGAYVKTGYMLLDTPLYTVLIGWLGAAYCVYVGMRVKEMGFSIATVALTTGISGFALGVVGENLFVCSGMWTYETARWHLWTVPAFVTATYGIAYGVQPLFNRWPPVVNGLAIVAVIAVTSIALGLITGFYPR